MTRLVALIAATAAAAVALPPAPAAAASRVRVGYADLDLATEAGRTVLDGRIAAAAARVCGSMNLRELSQLSACRAETAAAARTRLPRAEAGDRIVALR